MIEDLLITKVISCDELITDHNILAMTINSLNIFGRRAIATEKRKNIKRDIYTLDKMTDDLEKITIGKKHKFIDNLQYIIQKYNWNSISIYNITNGLFSNNKDVLLSLLKELSLLIKTKLDVKDQQFIIDQIENNVNKRLERLDTHKK